MSVTNKLYVDIVHFVNIFGGSIYFDKSQNGYYKWQVQSEANLQSFIYYIKILHLRLSKIVYTNLLKNWMRRSKGR